jgi:hypothetical protein
MMKTNDFCAGPLRSDERAPNVRPPLTCESSGRCESRQAVALLIVGISFFCGCRDVGTTWSAQVRSPDGNWVALARSQQWGGRGGAADATRVYLKWTKGNVPPIEILAFSHEYATMSLNMEWLDPQHLVVTYGASASPGDKVNLHFQAVKCSDISISLRELPPVVPSPKR